MDIERSQQGHLINPVSEILNTKKVWGGIETATYRTSWATFTTATLPFSCYTLALSYT